MCIHVISIYYAASLIAPIAAWSLPTLPAPCLISRRSHVILNAIQPDLSHLVSSPRNVEPIQTTPGTNSSLEIGNVILDDCERHIGLELNSNHGCGRHVRS